MLSDFEEKAKSGQVITVADIKAAYEKAIGKSLDRSRGQIYRVLERHGWRQDYAKSKHPNKARRGNDRCLKKINSLVRETQMAKNNIKGKVRLMFQDEAGFGRINKPKYCWCIKGIRPVVPSRYIREYRYTYGAVDPIDGESFFLVLPYANTSP